MPLRLATDWPLAPSHCQTLKRMAAAHTLAAKEREKEGIWLMLTCGAGPLRAAAAAAADAHAGAQAAKKEQPAPGAKGQAAALDALTRRLHREADAGKRRSLLGARAAQERPRGPALARCSAGCVQAPEEAMMAPATCARLIMGCKVPVLPAWGLPDGLARLRGG
jgi:hypothetical protein